MSESDLIGQLEGLLGSPNISQRKAGIAMAAEMLSGGQERVLVRALLEDLIAHEPLLTVREQAQAALAEDERRHSNASPDYVFGATCPNGHVSYYDKRKVCPKSGTVIRRVVFRGGREVEEIYLPMSAEPPILPGKPLSDEHKRLLALFDELKKNQLTFLDEAGKRIIELSSGMLGLLLAVVAFGKDFPPDYLKHNPDMQALVAVTLAAFVLALLAGVLTVQPRAYDFYDDNLSGMRRELEKIRAHNSRWMKAANWLFFSGSVLLALLIAVYNCPSAGPGVEPAPVAGFICLVKEAAHENQLPYPGAHPGGAGALYLHQLAQQPGGAFPGPRPGLHHPPRAGSGRGRPGPARSRCSRRSGASQRHHGQRDQDHREPCQRAGCV